MIRHGQVRRASPPGEPPDRRRWRIAGLAGAGALAAGTLVVGASPASAAPETFEDVSIEWEINDEVQGSAFFGGCNYLSAGESDGSQSAYQTSAGDVQILKDGGTPTWETKCQMTDGDVNQRVVWSGGTGTVDPETGDVDVEFTGMVSMNFYGGLAPFTIQDPVLTVDSSGTGQLVATLLGYGSSMDNPNEKWPLDPVEGVVVAELSGVDSANSDGFTVTPDYEGVEYTPPAGSGGTPQNRTNEGWGSWPTSFVDFHYETGLTSYWYTSGGAADAKKPPAPITVGYDGYDGGDGGNGGDGGGNGDGDPEPGEGEQVISVEVPDDGVEPGEFIWSIDGDQTVDLGETTNQGTYLQATGEIDPISVTDTRIGGSEWTISGQVGDFNDGLSGKYLGWSPKVVEDGAGAMAGEVVEPGIDEGNGLTDPSVLAAAPNGHELGSAGVGADLDLQLPVDTPEGSYSATLTITALS